MEQTPSTPQSTELPPTPQSPHPPPPAVTSASSSSLPPPTTSSSFTNPNANPSPSPKPPTTTQSQQQSTSNSQSRPSFNTRPWQQPPPYSHFSLPSPPLPSSASTPASIAAPQPPRGGVAIGVPAHSPSAPSPSPTSFSSPTSSSFGQQSQIRQPTQGMGMAGTLGPTTSMRPSGVPSHHLRPSHRPQTSPSSQPSDAQNFQGHGMIRASSLGSPASPSPTGSQGSQSQNQPWLSSGTQAKPPLPTSSHRPQMSPQSFQQRSHISQQHHPNMPTTPQQQPVSSGQQGPQLSTSGQQQELYSPQFPPSRIQQSISHQQQMARGTVLGSQRPSLPMAQSSALPLGTPSRTSTADPEEFSNRIVSKRSIQELVNQVDPSEKLDPEVEDILVDIAEDFVESITTFGCSLAKHRKSTTLEAKDILLHLERNWNMTLPGFSGDEIKTYKKPVVTDAHRERLSVIKKSIVAGDAVTKTSGGQSGGSAKGNLAKGPASIIGSPPNPKIREAA